MTRFQLILIAVAAVLLVPSITLATIFGSVRGVVHDPQHRPIQGAKVTLKAQNSDWTQSQDSDGNGGFEFSSVPIGNYARHSLVEGLSRNAARSNCSIGHQTGCAFRADDRRRKGNCQRGGNSRGSDDGDRYADDNGEPH